MINEAFGPVVFKKCCSYKNYQQVVLMEDPKSSDIYTIYNKKRLYAKLHYESFNIKRLVISYRYI